eukprot:5475-Heterococcus_DN1.PRE.1
MGHLSCSVAVIVAVAAAAAAAAAAAVSAVATLEHHCVCMTSDLFYINYKIAVSGTSQQTC